MGELLLDSLLNRPSRPAGSGPPAACERCPRVRASRRPRGSRSPARQSGAARAWLFDAVAAVATLRTGGWRIDATVGGRAGAMNLCAANLAELWGLAGTADEGRAVEVIRSRRLRAPVGVGGSRVSDRSRSTAGQPVCVPAEPVRCATSRSSGGRARARAPRWSPSPPTTSRPGVASPSSTPTATRSRGCSTPSRPTRSTGSTCSSSPSGIGHAPSTSDRARRGGPGARRQPVRRHPARPVLRDVGAEADPLPADGPDDAPHPAARGGAGPGRSPTCTACSSTASGARTSPGA